MRRCLAASILPPETTIAVGPVGRILPQSKAATPTAPAPSTTSPSCRAACRIPAAISSSLSRTTPSSSARHRPKVSRLSRPIPPPRVGERLLLHDLDRPAGGQRRRHGSAALHRYADHARTGAQRLERHGDAPGQTATGQERQNQLGLRQISEQFETDAALPGDDVGMVEGRDRRQALFADEPIDLGLRVVLRASDDPDFGAQRAHRVDLVRRHQRRHADHGAHARRARSVGDGAAMVAGGRGDQPAAARAASSSASSAFIAPRSLKAPIGWRVSSFRCTGTPQWRVSAAEATSGVRTTCPAMRRAADSTPAKSQPGATGDADWMQPADPAFAKWTWFTDISLAIAPA